MRIAVHFDQVILLLEDRSQDSAEYEDRVEFSDLQYDKEIVFFVDRFMQNTFFDGLPFICWMKFFRIV
jgi:hypothetical protein